MKKTLAMILALVMLLALSVPCFAEEEENTVKSGILKLNGERSLTFPGFEMIEFDDLNTMLLALQSGKIDEMCSLPKVVADYIANHNDNMVSVEPDTRVGTIYLAMAVLKDNTELLDLLNSAIEELKENGTLEKLEEEYIDAYLENGEDPQPIEMPKFDGAETIRVAVTGDLPPIDFIAADGTPAGFNVALLAEIAKLKGVNIELVSVTSGSRMINLTQEKADAIFYATHSKVNEELITADIPDSLAVTVPYFEDAKAEVEMK